MSVKPLPLIALVLIVPVAVLTFLAVRSLSLESDALSVRQDRLTKQRMDAAAALIISRLEAVGTEVLALTQAAYSAGGAPALSKLRRQRVFTYAYVSKAGQQLYAATAFEHQYDAARLMQDQAQALVESLSQEEPSAQTLVPYAGGFILLRCARGVGSTDICAAVEKSKVMHVLQAGLAPVAERTGLSRIGLLDPNGTVIGLQEDNRNNIASRPLSGLLKNWQLRVEEPELEAPLFQNTHFLYAIAAALIAGWLAMTWMLHRSSVLKEEAAAARANVIAQLAHELRTPLANLKLHTELLGRNSSDAEAVKRYGTVLDGEIDRLSLLAENAIAVARGAIARQKNEIAVPDDSLHALVERFKPMLKDAMCRVTLNSGADKSCNFDKTAWERCIVNLIDNARKYAPGSDIEITSSQSPDMLRLEVGDHGPGISVDQRDKIFQPLERGSATEASGFGLGLAAVRALARQNGGDCWVEPRSPGANFVLTMHAPLVESSGQEQAT